MSQDPYEREYWEALGGQYYDASTKTDCAMYCLARTLDDKFNNGVPDAAAGWFDKIESRQSPVNNLELLEEIAERSQKRVFCSFISWIQEKLL